MLYIGIDAGVDGAVGAVDKNGTFHALADLPVTTVGKFKFVDGMRLLGILRDFIGTSEARLYIEAATAMIPGSGIVAAAQIGRSLGGIVAVAQIKGHPFELVAPSHWKKTFNLQTPKGTKLSDSQKKALSLDLGRQRFPTAELELVKHHNRAEALLLADFGRRSNQGVL